MYFKLFDWLAFCFETSRRQGKINCFCQFNVTGRNIRVSYRDSSYMKPLCVFAMFCPFRSFRALPTMCCSQRRSTCGLSMTLWRAILMQLEGKACGQPLMGLCAGRAPRAPQPFALLPRLMFALGLDCRFFLDIASDCPASDTVNHSLSFISDGNVLALHRLLWNNQEKIGQYLSSNRWGCSPATGGKLSHSWDGWGWKEP